MLCTPRAATKALAVLTLFACALAPASLWADPLLEVMGDVSHEFGSSVAAIGDMNDDGYAEFAVGERKAQRVTVFDGKTGDERFQVVADPTTLGTSFGAVVEPAGDFDGDGIPDLLIAAWGSGFRAAPPGYAVVISGETQRQLQRFDGLRQTGFFGWSMRMLGDVNGDGVPDVVIGEPGVTGTSNGAAWVFSGKDGALLQDRSIEGQDPVANLGVALAVLGDVDFDGVPDYAVGAPNEVDKKGNRVGRVWIVSGAKGVRRLRIEKIDNRVAELESCGG